MQRKGRGTPWKLLRGGRGRPRTLRAETRPAVRQGTKRRSSKKTAGRQFRNCLRSEKGASRIKIFNDNICENTESYIFFWWAWIDTSCFREEKTHFLIPKWETLLSEWSMEILSACSTFWACLKYISNQKVQVHHNRLGVCAPSVKTCQPREKVCVVRKWPDSYFQTARKFTID